MYKGARPGSSFPGHLKQDDGVFPPWTGEPLGVALSSRLIAPSLLALLSLTAALTTAPGVAVAGDPGAFFSKPTHKQHVDPASVEIEVRFWRPIRSSTLVVLLNGRNITRKLQIIGNSALGSVGPGDGLIVPKSSQHKDALNLLGAAGGQGNFARRYDFEIPRALRLDYEAYGQPDAFSVHDSSGELATTGGLVSHAGTFFANATSRFVTAKVNAPAAGTLWNYTIACVN